MKFVIVDHGIVTNVVIADEPMGQNWVQSDTANIGDGYDGHLFTVPVLVAPQLAVDPCQWLIDIGPFADRFGSKKAAVDFSTDPVVMAFDKDLGRRKWVDLKDPRVAAALNYMAGHTVPGLGSMASPILTDADVNTILSTAVSQAENLALRRLYFP